MIQIELNEVAWDIAPTPDGAGRVVAYRDKQSGILVTVPFTAESWDLFARKVASQKIALPDLAVVR